jgi:methionyl-tRNA formyltransferase
MNIHILNDNPKSWIINYVPLLVEALNQLGHSVNCYNNSKDLCGGDILCALSCEKILKKDVLDKYKSVIVAHPSDLPKGKGWSPLAWQILEGKNQIVVSLIEAAESVDSGNIYFQEVINLNGYELNDEIKEIQFNVTLSLVIKYVESFPMEGIKQIGVETFYPKFLKENNRLDINKSIHDQFNLFRIVDNENYPAFFEIDGYTYLIKIYKEESV